MDRDQPWHCATLSICVQCAWLAWRCGWTVRCPQSNCTGSAQLPDHADLQTGTLQSPFWSRRVATDSHAIGTRRWFEPSVCRDKTWLSRYTHETYLHRSHNFAGKSKEGEADFHWVRYQQVATLLPLDEGRPLASEELAPDGEAARLRSFPATTGTDRAVAKGVVRKSRGQAQTQVCRLWPVLSSRLKRLRAFFAGTVKLSAFGRGQVVWQNHRRGQRNYEVLFLSARKRALGHKQLQTSFFADIFEQKHWLISSSELERPDLKNWRHHVSLNITYLSKI